MKFALEAFDFIDSLARLSTADEVLDAMERVLARYGFEALSFFGFPSEGRPLAEVVLAKRVPAELLRTYDERHYADIDPAFRLLRRTVEPFEWRDAPYDPVREPRASELLGMIADFGLSQGFVVPIPSPAGSHAGVWMAGSKPALTTQIKPALQLMALYAFHKVHRLVAPLHGGRPQLTMREHEVLKWVAAGKSTWAISEILGISNRTVDEHVKAAARKLGAANRTHAVAVALREGLIEL